ncbi:hypothetical protein EHM69_10435 [candidate division KSB1 bacterium]|nr:MAG: hypothetical protein EHM69_10435 [candidate division KSB1 bacterium]
MFSRHNANAVKAFAFLLFQGMVDIIYFHLFIAVVTLLSRGGKLTEYSSTKGGVMRKLETVVAGFFLLLGSVVCLARDLVQVDIAVGCHDRVNNTHSVFRNGIDGRYFAAWDNPSDSAGWILYDRAYYVIAVFELEDHDTIETHEVEFIEWAERLRLTATSNLGYADVWLCYGYKLNQLQPYVDAAEVGRFLGCDRQHDYWPIFGRCFIMYNEPVEYTDFIRHHFSNEFDVRIMHTLPDSFLGCGVNPSRFRYWTIRYWFAPASGDTLFVDPNYLQGCRRVFWTAEDGADPDYPSDPVFPVIYPDSTDLRVYHITEEQLNLPTGEYSVSVERLIPFSVRSASVPAGTYSTSERLGFTITLDSSQTAEGDHVAVFRKGTYEHRYPLGGYDPRIPMQPKIIGGVYE